MYGEENVRSTATLRQDPNNDCNVGTDLDPRRKIRNNDMEKEKEAIGRRTSVRCVRQLRIGQRGNVLRRHYVPPDR